MESYAKYSDRPVPNIDHAEYWQGVKRRELLYQRCEACELAVFHPRTICPYCLGSKLAYEKSSGCGKVYSFTIQHHGLSPYWQAKLPYALGIIALDEGYYMFAEITPPDLNLLKINAPVEVWFDEVDDETVLPKFKVVS